MAKKILKSWLKAAYLENSELFPTEEGTAQGGVISPTLANLTLNGLENYLKTCFKPGKKLCSTGKSTTRVSICINIVRYADDFIRSKQTTARTRQSGY